MGAHRFVFLAAAAALAACASAGPRAKEPVTLASDGPLDGVRAPWRSR
ncbi:MAG: hypothetical protein JNL38_04865 [Myxococcales bacterium]|nr:hypothetical protein [Myxococcales bacterium]